MKIGIFIDILKNRKTGIEYYAQNLVQQLLKLDKKNEYFLIRHDNLDINFKAETETEYSEIICKKRNKVIIFLRNTVNVFPKKLISPIIKYALKFIMPDFFNNKKLDSLDILFSPNFGAELESNLGAYKIITVYDLTPIRMPQCHSKDTVIFFDTIFKDILKKADKIIAISEFTKKDLVMHLNIPEEKISTVYPGLNPHIIQRSQFSDAVIKYNLPKDFILYFGTIEPRKNIITLLKAYALLKKEGYTEKLVIAGGKGWYYADVFKMVKQLNLENSVIFTGYIDEEDVPKMYSAAKLLVYPSFYEGFGLPVLEAMSCKCPVITSNNTSLPEAGGDAAIYIDPKNEKQICDAIKKVLSSKKLREDMIKKGLAQASKFSWEESAKRVIKIFKEAEEAMQNERN